MKVKQYKSITEILKKKYKKNFYDFEDFEDVLYTFEARPYKMLKFQKTRGKITKIKRIK